VKRNNLSEDSLQVLKTLYFSKDQKGLITRKNALIFGRLVLVETVCHEAEPCPSHFVSLTYDGRKFCEENFMPHQETT
jgi:hypothetical protein